MRRIWLLCVGTVTISCAPLPPIPFVTDADVSPPVITSLGFAGPLALEVGFDESARMVGEPLVSTGIVLEDVLQQADAVLAFRFETPPSATEEHSIEAQVADDAGNHLRFLAHFHGLNALMPGMIINEFTTQGSGRNPDLVEIRVLTDGNLAGATLYEGTPSSWEQRYVFPDLDVVAGDYIVVHFRPQGIAEEINELTDRGASGGNNATPDAWDFWVDGGTGLSGNNGVLSLCENPLGGYMDAVLYSNRTSESDEHYRGFGSRDVMERADELAAAGAWVAAGDLIAPEDAINPDPSTGTRSMARASGAADTNTAADWHITPTRGLTPGTINTDEVYDP